MWHVKMASMTIFWAPKRDETWAKSLELRLDVRYMTKPEEGEGGPLPPAPPPDPVIDQSELIEKLRKQIAANEKEMKDQRYTIQATRLSNPLQMMLNYLLRSSDLQSEKRFG